MTVANQPGRQGLLSSYYSQQQQQVHEQETPVTSIPIVGAPTPAQSLNKQFRSPLPLASSGQKQQRRPGPFHVFSPARFFRKTVNVPLWLLILMTLGLLGSVATVSLHSLTWPTSQSTAGKMVNALTTTRQQANVMLQPSPATIHATPIMDDAQQNWPTVQTFSGSGNRTSLSFQINGQWRLHWSCDPASFGGAYDLIADIRNSDTSSLSLGIINTICQDGNTSGITVTQQHDGFIYLTVSSEGAWTIQLQKLRT